MSLDRTNELLMLWNKSCVPNKNFSTACSHSRVLMASKACAHEVFDVRNRKSVAPSFGKDVRNLGALLEKGKLYPARCNEIRALHEFFWWDLVRPSKEKVRSDRAKAREQVKEDNNVQRLFDFLAG